MITPAEAEQRILAALPPAGQEECPIASAHGRVLRAALRADRDFPPFDRSTMDGYALRSAALAAGVEKFQIEALQAAGHPALALGVAPEACIEIMTGAPLPAGADAVVPYEETTREGDQMVVAAGTVLAPGNAVHRRASDHRAGETIIAPGIRLSSREIAVAAACGCATLTVSRRPTIAVVATGDELVEVAASVAPHQIRRSNDYALRAALIEAGYPAVERFQVGDDQSQVAELLRRVLAEYDVVLLTGGVSRGKFDLIPAELERQGVKKILHGVNQRPGKPLWFGLGPRQQPVFALPGNPVSAYLCLHRYALPGLAAASGLRLPPPLRVPLASAFAFRPKMTRFLPVTIGDGPTGPQAKPEPGNTSGDFSGLVGTDGFVELPPEQDEFPAGWMAPYRPWA
jgi:molybdopterin molybdotransferase